MSLRSFSHVDLQFVLAWFWNFFPEIAWTVSSVVSLFPRDGFEISGSTKWRLRFIQQRLFHSPFDLFPLGLKVILDLFRILTLKLKKTYNRALDPFFFVEWLLLRWVSFAFILDLCELDEHIVCGFATSREQIRRSSLSLDAFEQIGNELLGWFLKCVLYWHLN